MTAPPEKGREWGRVPLHVILPAGGRGERMGGTPKQFRLLGASTVLERVIQVFRPFSDSLWIALPEDQCAHWRQRYPELQWVVGGSTRFESVRHAFEAIPNANADDLVLIHDVARCFFHPGDLTEALKRTLDTGALIYAAQMTDTVKQVSNSDEQWLANTLDRQRLVRAQTPQIFRYGLLQEAYAHEDHSSDDVVTDEAQLVERLGHRVAFWCSPQKNEKLTFEEDFNMGFGPRVFVGHGFDVHAFAPDRSLFLCGIPIAAGPGLAGHSDADVALHALMDALLGAMGLGDIGEWFPDHDARWKDVRSTVLLQQVMQALREKGAVIGNVDLTIVAQTPKLSPFREDMKHSLATHLGVASEHINVKATTTEHLGFVGRKEGMACHAVVSLYRGVSSCNP